MFDMMKKSFGVIAFLLVTFIIGLGFVGAINGVDFVSPSIGLNLSGSNVLVNWTNENSTQGLFLQYNANSCNPGPNWNNLNGGGYFNSDDSDYEWDTTSLSDGQYCLRLLIDSVIYDTSGLFTIDNTVPEVEILSATEGLEDQGGSDRVKIEVNKSDNIGLMSCSINWGDNKTSSCDLANGVQNRRHKYKDNGVYTVVVTVQDFAGNVAVDSMDVTVHNLIPYEVNITLPSVLIEGFPMTIGGAAADVDADMPITNWLWEIDNVSIATTQDLVYAFSSEGNYSIRLTATDKDGGSNYTEVVVEVEEAIGLASYEIEAKEKLKEKPYINEIKALSDCDLIYSPEDGIVVSKDGGNKCKIVWTPRNNQTGDTFIIMNASNGTDVEYYSVNVTVYSWMIDFVSGTNIFSIPLLPESEDIDDILDADVAGNADVIWAYVYDEDSGENVWMYNEPLSDGSRWTSYSSRIQEIVPGYGYYLIMNASSDAKGIGDMMPGVGQTPPEINVVNGWNLVGHYGLDDLVYSDSFDTFNYGPVIDLDGSSDGKTVREGAYWVHASSDGSYAPSQKAIDSVM